MGLLKAIVGGTVGLVVGTMTCAPLTGMVGGAFIAQDWDNQTAIACRCVGTIMTLIRVQSPKPLKPAFGRLTSPRLGVNHLGAFIFTVIFILSRKKVIQVSNDTCDGCGSEQLIDFHDRGEVICAVCGVVKGVNLEASWQPGERDPNHSSREQLTWIPFERLEMPIKSH